MPTAAFSKATRNTSSAKRATSCPGSSVAKPSRPIPHLFKRCVFRAFLRSRPAKDQRRRLENENRPRTIHKKIARESWPVRRRCLAIAWLAVRLVWLPVDGHAASQDRGCSCCRPVPLGLFDCGMPALEWYPFSTRRRHRARRRVYCVPIVLSLRPLLSSPAGITDAQFKFLSCHAEPAHAVDQADAAQRPGNLRRYRGSVV